MLNWGGTYIELGWIYTVHKKVTTNDLYHYHTTTIVTKTTVVHV